MLCFYGIFAAMKKLVVFSSLLFSVSFALAELPDSAVYTGYLKLQPAYQGQDSIAMQLSVQKQNDSTWSWNSKFEGGMAKNYTLIEHSDGSYSLDENNGIVLKGVYAESLLSFTYYVDETLYQVVYNFSTADKQISYSLFFGQETLATEAEGYRIRPIQVQGKQHGTFIRQ